MRANTARLLITCPDRTGIIAAVAAFLAQYDGNILDSDQHTDPEHGRFFMRVEVDLAGFRLTPANFATAWQPLADKYQMSWWVYWGHLPKRMAVFVSRESHCLLDLLWRWKSGELRADIPCVLGNHAELADIVRGLGIPYYHLEITPENRVTQEQRGLELLREHRVDFVVLARYMRILPPDYVAAYPNRIINIHHSFLPAFAGPKPYRQAYDRGVKIIGATSHYVTPVLDDGPIIAQQTLSISHRDTVDDLIRKGRDLERVVLASAVRLHIGDRILVSRNKTVVFD